MRISKQSFLGGTLIRIENDASFLVELTTLGAGVHDVVFLSRRMIVTPVKEEHYRTGFPRYGKSVGPIAGRVKEGYITVDGKRVRMSINEGKHCLHSGNIDFSDRQFAYDLSESEEGVRVLFALEIAETPEYPTSGKVEISYFIPKNRAELQYSVHFVTEKEAPKNVLNHTYFSLGENDFRNLKLQILADKVGFYNEEKLLSEIREVNDVMDFREARPLSRYMGDPAWRWDALDLYDHYYLFNPSFGESQIILEGEDVLLAIKTSLPGTMVFSGLEPTKEPWMPIEDGKPTDICFAIEPSELPNPAIQGKDAFSPRLEQSYTTIYRYFDKHAFEKEDCPEKAVNALVRFIHQKGFMDDKDQVFYQNMLLHALRLPAPIHSEVDDAILSALLTPSPFLPPIRNRLMELGLKGEEVEKELVFLIGMILPPPSQIDFYLNRHMVMRQSKKAADLLYSLSLAGKYVEKEKVDKNIVFDGRFEDGPALELSINLSKPEKRNSDIAKLVGKKESGYPPCVLCYENVGFGGSAALPARGNLRIMGIFLDEEKWYLQYSPYGYFKHHCIAFTKEHKPMASDAHIFRCLLDFADMFPHFFIGSNSDLPIVGGSILNHEHFQGGEAALPIMRAPNKKEFPSPIPGVRLYQVDFYDTALLLESTSSAAIAMAAETIRAKWRDYSDPDNGILSHTDGTPHNAVTAILRKSGPTYRLYMVLRNNRCDADYPDGIFHAHPENQHIKSEAVGLIEASGLFVLPPRLLRQSKILEEGVSNDVEFRQLVAEHEDLSGFGEMYEALKKGISKESYIAGVCRRILRDVAVYKDNEKGQQGLEAFLKEVLQ